MSDEIYKLMDIPKESRIKVGKRTFVTFHHIDGLYSYCTSKDGKTLHLAAWTPLRKEKDYYVVAEPI